MTTPRPLLLVLLAAIFAVGAALRVASAGGDMWVDEIWSLNQIAVARASGAWRDWIALYFHDNTHALNTLYLTALGPDASMLAARGLSLAAGLATIPAAAWAGWRHGPATGLLLALLAAISYPFVHYAGEARGYGPMLCAGFAAFALLDRWLDRPSTSKLAGFVAVSLLGFAAHLTFAVALTGLGVWAALEIYRNRRDVVATAAALVPLFGLQLVVVLGYGAVALGNFVVGGVTFLPAVDSVAIMTALTFGADPESIDLEVAAFAAGVGALAGTVYLAMRGDRTWLLFAVIVVLFPLGGILIERQPYVLPRYFLVAAPFAQMLVAGVWIGLWRNGGGHRVALGLLLAAFIGGNVGLLQNFLRDGRGHYADAIAAMAAESAGAVRVAGHPGFSVGTMFRYHIVRLGLNARFRFVDSSDENAAPADWFILGYLAARSAPPEQARAGTVYDLLAVYPHWGLSGDTWAVYRLR